MEEEKYANSNKQKRKEEQEKEGETQKGSRMNVSNFTEQESMSSKEPTIEFQASKKRKVVEKTVVTVRIEDNLGKQKSEGPPSDLWSWRKYGQKPIKGSPFPRGYYKCSTSKGCLAKKQVERCRTDASMIIITYTSSHNHPSPDLQTTNLTPPPPQTQPIEDIPPTTPKPQEHIITSDEDVNEGLHYSSPISCSQEENPLKGILDKTHDSLDLLFEEQPLPYPHLLTFSTSKSEENDFYDELEELPTSSSFTSFMRSNFFDERILVLPS